MDNISYIRKIMSADAFLFAADFINKYCFQVLSADSNNKLEKLHKITTIELLKILIMKFASDLDIKLKSGIFEKLNRCCESSGIEHSDELHRKIHLVLQKNPTENNCNVNFKKFHVAEIAYIFELMQQVKLKYDEKTNKLSITQCQTTRKSTGSVYTPLHVVKFIVKHTITPFIETQLKTQKINDLIQVILNLKILDPSVGGGVFLIEAAHFLTQQVIVSLKKVSANPKNPICNKISKIAQKSTSKNSQVEYLSEYDLVLYLVLNNCLFGVDLNPIAVEITKISLQLLNRTNLELNLGSKIKHGNSLNCKKNKQIQRETPFIWENEFPEIFGTSPIKIAPDNLGIFRYPKQKSLREKGFDAIISNPPYLFGENISSKAREITQNYSLATGQFDEYWLFYELALKELLRTGGMHGNIIPDSVLIRDYSGLLREKLQEYKIHRIWHSGDVFDNMHISSVVLIWQKKHRENSENLVQITDKSGLVKNSWKIKQSIFSDFPNNPFFIYLKTTPAYEIIKQLNSCEYKIAGSFDISRGEDVGIKSISQNSGSVINQICLIAGRNIHRFYVDISKCKKIPTNFEFKKKCNMKKSKNARILIRKTGKDLIAAFDDSNSVLIQSAYCLTWKNDSDAPEDIYFLLLGILNSKLLDFWINLTCTAYKHIFPQLNQSTILNIPLPFDVSQRKAPEFVKKVRELAELRVDLCKDMTKTQKLQEHQLFLEGSINQNVMDFYRLSPKLKTFLTKFAF